MQNGARRLVSVALGAVCLLGLATAALASTAVPQWQDIFKTAAEGTTAAAPLAARELADGTVLVVTKTLQTVHYNHDGTVVSFQQLKLNPPDRHRGAAKGLFPGHPDTTPFELVNAHAAIDGFGRVVVAIVDQPNYGFLDSGNIETAKFDGLTGDMLWPAPQFFHPETDAAYPTDVFLDPQGDVIVTGLFTQPRQVTIKYDGKTGALLWGPIVNTSLSFPLWTSTAAVDLAGDVYVSVSDPPATQGSITTVKYSGVDGSGLGSATFTPGGPDAYPEVSTIDADGRYVYTAVSGRRVFTVALDTTVFQWISVFDPPAGADNVIATSIVTDAHSNDVFVSSRYDVSGSSTSTTQKLSHTSGVVLWTGASIPIAGANQPVQAALASNGDVILGSPLATSGDLRLNFWRYRGADGALVWGPTEVGPIDDVDPAQFFVGSNGRIFTSELAFNGTDPALSSGEIDAATGVVAWGPTPATFPHVDLARFASLAAGPDGQPVVLGFTGIGVYQMVTLKYDRATGASLWGPIVYAPADIVVSPIQVVVDSSNDVFVLGFNQNLDPTGYQSVLFKYSGSTGAVLWGPVFLDNVGAVALAIDPAGNAIVLAATIDPLGGPGHVAVAKIDGANGSVLWGPVIFASGGQFDSDSPQLLALDASGNALVAGDSDISGTLPWFALKFASGDGSLVWGPSSGTMGFPYSSAVDGSGNLAVSGNDENGAMTTIKYASGDGSILWGPVHAPGVGGAMAFAPNGDVVASGDVLNPSGNLDFSTIRYKGSDGSVVWGPVVTDAAGGEDVPLLGRGVAFDAAGNVVLGGASQTFVRNKDIALVKYDGATGATIWGPVFLGAFDNEILAGLDIRGDSIVVGATSQAGMLTAMLDESLGIQTPAPTLAPAFCGEDYSLTFVAQNGSPGYTWSLVSGSLPAGLSLSAGGALTGAPAEQGSFSFTVRVTDAALGHADRAYTLVVTDDPTGYAILAFPGAPCHYTLAVTTGTWTSYLWLPNGETTPEIDVAPIERTTYGVELGDGSGCVLRLSVTLGGTGYEDHACLAPSVDAILPTSGPAAGGTPVTITGTKFEPGAILAIGGTEVAATVVDPAHITATTPAMIVGALASVLVRNPDTGTALVQGLFFADFLDVPQDNVFHDSVEALFRSGVTVGCGEGLFCVDQDTTRAQMAVFLLRALLGPTYNPPLATGDVFADVPSDAFAAAWIEDLYHRGITGGCLLDPLRYCPDANITRAEMAVLLLKTLLGSGYTPPPATGTVFADVAAGDFAAAFIEDLYHRGITAGCLTDPLRYCPDRPVSRGEMAAFLVLTFSL